MHLRKTNIHHPCKYFSNSIFFQVVGYTGKDRTSEFMFFQCKNVQKSVLTTTVA